MYSSRLVFRFFERIGKTYRKEGWNLILTSILKWSVQCAKQLEFWETVVECLVEMMSPGTLIMPVPSRVSCVRYRVIYSYFFVPLYTDMPSRTEKRQSSLDELVSILYNDAHPANNVVHKPLVLSMPQINSFGKRPRPIVRTIVLCLPCLF